MPRYNPAEIEPKWQAFWEQNGTFKTPEMPTGPKLYVLDMFPYPSGSGLHVGHPEGYTATDIVCRFERMRGKCVLHPMGFDAFGLPAEEHAIKTGQHPRLNTEQNIATFTRQLKMLGFCYDWSRVLATTDVEYFRWTQWIFLQLFDTWFDAEQQKGRPISELPIPEEVKKQGYAGRHGEQAYRKYQDDHRLAYQADALVNWCPELATVLANEEVIDGKSERGGHPVVRMPLRQWMLRITSYADRLEKDLEQVDWPEGIKKLQRDWIGRSVGAEVDFFVPSSGPGMSSLGPVDPATADSIEFAAWQEDREWKQSKSNSGFPKKALDNVLRIYTTRPDTLFGVTYMVIAPEHPFVPRLTTHEQKAAVEAYVQKAASKSDRDRQDVAKGKTGVFTGSYAINPVNGEKVPVWVADYVLWGYGTGAIMAVPAHDERDREFANTMGLPLIRVVEHPVKSKNPDGAPDILIEFCKDKYFSEYSFVVYCPTASRANLSQWLDSRKELVEFVEIHEASSAGFFLLVRRPIADAGIVRPATPLYVVDLQGAYEFEDGTAINSGPYNGLTTPEFKAKITADLTAAGLGREAVNYKLRDWLFSRQRFWGEPFPILHELGADGKPNGMIRAVEEKDLPVDLPHLDDYKPHGKPEPPLGKAPAEWLTPTIDGKRYRRETNTMPQWAGSCWYYLRFIDPKNGQAFIDREKEKAWMPIDLYVGGAEHAVLHLLYSRFWHKVLFDRGHVSCSEPFQKLVNQGMILGEMEYQIKPEDRAAWQERVAGKGVQIVVVKDDDGSEICILKQATSEPGVLANLSEEQVEKRKGKAYLAGTDLELSGKCEKMSKSRGNVVNPDVVVRDYGADSLRLYEMFMGPLPATKPWSMQGVSGVRGFLDRVWRLIVDDRADELKLNSSVKNVDPTPEQARTLHKTIKAVTRDIENMDFNTAIARMMEFTNFFTKESVRPQHVMETFLLLLSPFAPHLAEELWQLLGHSTTLAYEKWPPYDESLTKDAEMEIPVQILGKLRGVITLPAGSDQPAILAAAKADPKIAELLAGKQIVKEIFVPGKLVNFVVK